MENRRLAVVMFTDMVGYSRKMQEDEPAALVLLQEHNQLISASIEAEKGHVVKTIGDAFMAEFDSVLAAISCAVDIQSKLTRRNQEHSGLDLIEVRIGIHAGDVVFQDGDIFGDGVNIASRIESIASAGRIFVSGDVQSLAKGKCEYEFFELGSKKLKNIREAVPVYEVAWDPERKASPAFSSRRPLRTFVMAAAALLILGLGAFYLFPLLRPVSEAPSLVVLQFDNQSHDEVLERLQAEKIIQDIVIKKFYNWPRVRLISPLRVLRVLREKKINVRSLSSDPVRAAEVARSMGARLMVTGSIKKVDNKYVISAHLNDLKKDSLLDTRVLRLNTRADILGPEVEQMSDEFMNRISREFGLKKNKGGMSGVGKMTTQNLEAYSHFIRGYELASLGIYDEGIKEMKLAVKIDPEFALAYSELSCSNYFAGRTKEAGYYGRKAATFRDKITGSSKEALIFKGNLAWNERKHTQAEKVYRLIVELYPDDRDGYLYLGTFLEYHRGDHKQALQLYNTALQLSPDYFPIHREMSMTYARSDKEEQAVKVLQNFIRTYPDSKNIPFARRTIIKIRNGVNKSFYGLLLTH